MSNDPPSVLLSSDLDEINRGLDSTPSGRIEKPEGKIAMSLGSQPVIADSMLLMSTGA